MARYDLGNPLQREQFRLRAERLIEKGAARVELTVRDTRSLAQNSYLWLCLSYWGTQVGYTKEEAEAFYKKVNAATYYVPLDEGGVSTHRIRHTYELTTEEMTLTIDRFRHWAAMNEACPVYIPTPDDRRMLELMEREVAACERYL